MQTYRKHIANTQDVVSAWLACAVVFAAALGGAALL
ncbi:hypothetical protein J2851_006837 [Azospirillum rugosum]|uniref:Uncharacterized protein n=1 Tax=Azospirillum rugosum TaxID=416170 RepID=A0ABS4SWT6_9PROT|nr:hypothetical protein [Azospirillum rugosum]MDQ0530650.1 hypothetical protein [Azospirillum rugosum]